MRNSIYQAATLILLTTLSGACLPVKQGSGTLSADQTERAYSERARNATITSYEGDDLLEVVEKKLNEQRPFAGMPMKIQTMSLDVEDLVKLETEKEEVIGWPPLPRRMLNMDKSNGWDMAIHFGVKGSFFDLVEVNAGGNLTVAASTTKSLTLIKNTPTNTEPLLKEVEVEFTQELAEELRLPPPNENAPGQTISLQKPVVDDGYEYAGFCSYRSSVSEGTRLEGYVKFTGNGTSGGRDWASEISLTQMSSFFRITEDDTILSLQNLCQEIYELEVKESIKMDLAAVMYSASMDISSVNAESRAIQAALYGPNMDRIKLSGHHWNIRQVRIDSNTKGVVKVEGELIHNVRAQRDDSIYFSCTHDHGSRTQYDTRVAQRSATSGWRNAGRGLIERICYDAFIEFAKD